MYMQTLVAIYLLPLATVGNVNNFGLNTKSRSYTHFGPKKVDFGEFWRQIFHIPILTFSRNFERENLFF